MIDDGDGRLMAGSATQLGGGRPAGGQFVKLALLRQLLSVSRAGQSVGECNNICAP